MGLGELLLLLLEELDELEFGSLGVAGFVGGGRGVKAGVVGDAVIGTAMVTTSVSIMVVRGILNVSVSVTCVVV